MSPQDLQPIASPSSPPSRLRRADGRRARLVLVALAMLPIASLLFLELVGARGDVGFLSGTLPAHGELELWSGGCYALSWFAAVVASPIVLLAIALDYGLERLRRLYEAHR